MTDGFSEWFIPKMDKIGYEQTYIEFRDNITFIKFGNNVFRVIYVKKPIELLVMDLWLKTANEPILFIVDSDLITPLSVNEPWLRAIHTLYYGRIYAWDGKGIMAIHHDKQFNALGHNGLIDVSVISFEDVDCWYPGFPGVFRIARFDDAPFWKAKSSKQANEWAERVRNTSYDTQSRKPPRSNENEEYWRKQYARYANEAYTPPKQEYTKEDVFRDFREAFERNKRAYEQVNNAYYPPPPYAPKGDKWLTLLLAEGTLAGAKRKYRELAHEYHPDKAGNSPEVLEVMQLINAAYARAKEILV